MRHPKNKAAQSRYHKRPANSPREVQEAYLDRAQRMAERAGDLDMLIRIEEARHELQTGSLNLGHLSVPQADRPERTASVSERPSKEDLLAALTEVEDQIGRIEEQVARITRQELD